MIPRCRFPCQTLEDCFPPFRTSQVIHQLGKVFVLSVRTRTPRVHHNRNFNQRQRHNDQVSNEASNNESKGVFGSTMVSESIESSKLFSCYFLLRYVESKMFPLLETTELNCEQTYYTGCDVPGNSRPQQNRTQPCRNRHQKLSGCGLSTTSVA